MGSAQVPLTMEDTKIQELRSRLGSTMEPNSIYGDPCYLLLWLKNSSFNLDKAESNIRAALKWRKENGIDELAEMELCPRISAMIPARFDGISKDGNTVISLQAGNGDFRGAYEKYGKERYTTYWKQVAAKMEQQVIQVNRKRNANSKSLTADSVQGYTILLDGKNFKIGQMMNPRLLADSLVWLRESLNYYVGYSSIIFVNVSPIGKPLLKIILPIIRSSNIKLELYGTDTCEWQKEVFTRIDPGQLLLSP